MPKYGKMGEMKDLLLMQARMLYRDKILTPRITVHARQFAVRSEAAQHSPLLQFAVS